MGMDLRSNDFTMCDPTIESAESEGKRMGMGTRDEAGERREMKMKRERKQSAKHKQILLFFCFPIRSDSENNHNYV